MKTLTDLDAVGLVMYNNTEIKTLYIDGANIWSMGGQTLTLNMGGADLHLQGTTTRTSTIHLATPLKMDKDGLFKMKVWHEIDRSGDKGASIGITTTVSGYTSAGVRLITAIVNSQMANNVSHISAWGAQGTGGGGGKKLAYIVVTSATVSNFNSNCRFNVHARKVQFF